MLKKAFLFILCLLPWFFTSLLPLNYDFYEKLNLPFFAPPNIFWRRPMRSLPIMPTGSPRRSGPRIRRGRKLRSIGQATSGMRHISSHRPFRSKRRSSMPPMAIWQSSTAQTRSPAYWKKGSCGQGFPIRWWEA